MAGLVVHLLPPSMSLFCAENANDGFKPTSGHIDEISFRSTPEARSFCALLHVQLPGCVELLGMAWLAAAAQLSMACMVGGLHCTLVPLVPLLA